MSKSQRTKGHNFEREIARDFVSIGYPDARRHLEYQQGEADGRDLQNTGKFAVQCKCRHSYVPISAIEEIAQHAWQATGHELEYGTRLLITKADNKPAMAVLPWADLMKLIEKVKVLT